jgi:hypothetical protein
METAIQVLWWIGIVAALGLTAVVLKLVFLVLRTLKDIGVLAEHTATAAEGMAATTASPGPLPDAVEAAESLRRGAERLGEVAGRIRKAVGPAGQGS